MRLFCLLPKTSHLLRFWGLSLIHIWLFVFVSSDAFADQLVEVTASTLNVRAAPSMNAPIVGLVNKHDQLVVRPVSDNWAAVLSGTEINGYVSRKHVRRVERWGTTVDRPEPTETSSVSSLFVICLVTVMGALLLFRARKTKSVDTVDTKPLEPQQKNPKVGNTFAEGALDEREKEKRIEDFPAAKVEYVIDGDTVVVSIAWTRTKVRLDSIDCPENGQPWGDIATAGLIKMIGGRKIRLEKHGEDHHGRLLATIYVRDKYGSEWLNVNEKMVVKGHAWVMRRYFNHLSTARRDSLVRMERWARRKKVGLWNTSNPIPPWRWRRQD